MYKRFSLPTCLYIVAFNIEQLTLEFVSSEETHVVELSDIYGLSR